LSHTTGAAGGRCRIIQGPEDGQARSPWAQGGCVVLMAQARLLFFGAVLLTLALPGHPLVPLSGLPLDLSAQALLLLVVGWMIALPGNPPRATLLTGAAVGLAVLKVTIAGLAPANGLEGSYR